jgi:uncharacterized protein YndB with AHSA1/START domain
MNKTSPPPMRSAGVSLVTRRTIRATADRLFEAWTRPADLLRWWGPAGVTCTDARIDLRVGGAYLIANRLPDGTLVRIMGDFEVVEPPHRLVYSWRIDANAGTSERVTVHFEPREDGTDVIVIHERIASADLRDGHERGWQGCLEGLGEYLAAP